MRETREAARGCTRKLSNAKLAVPTERLTCSHLLVGAADSEASGKRRSEIALRTENCSQLTSKHSIRTVWSVSVVSVVSFECFRAETGSETGSNHSNSFEPIVKQWRSTIRLLPSPDQSVRSQRSVCLKRSDKKPARTERVC